MPGKDDVLNKELELNEEELIREHIKSWKEEVVAELNEEFENEKQKMIQVLEEENLKYREELKEEFADKMMVALNEMKDEIRAEVVSEMVSSNPELQILEKIKELVAPTLNESYGGNLYAEELTLLRDKVSKLEKEAQLEEGARTLAKLLSDYDRKTQKLILNLIKEGNAEEVTEQFYSIIESLADDEEDLDEEEDMEDDEEEKPKKGKKKDDDEEEDDSEDDEEEDDSEDDEEDDKEDDEEEDEEDMGESVISEGLKGENSNKEKTNQLKNRMRNLLG